VVGSYWQFVAGATGDAWYYLASCIPLHPPIFLSRSLIVPLDPVSVLALGVALVLVQLLLALVQLIREVYAFGQQTGFWRRLRQGRRKRLPRRPTR